MSADTSALWLQGPLPPPGALAPGVAAALDDDAALAGSTRWRTREDGGREGETLFAIEGIYCAACAGIIESALRRVPGVAQAEVNAASRRLRVRWDAQRVALSALVEAVQRAGYRALPAQREDAHSALRKESRAALWRLFVAGFCMMQVMMLTLPVYVAAPGEIAPDLLALLRWASWMLTLPVMLFCVGPFFGGAWRALRQRRIGMDVPVAIGIGVTFIAGTGVTFDPGGRFGAEPYLDSLTMFVAFLLAGRWLELRARARSTEALDALLLRMPDSVERIDADGATRPVATARLRVGDRIRVAAGQAFPGDGTLQEGRTQVDEAMLSGESRPIERAPGDAVIGGSLNLGAPVVVVLAALGDGTRYAQIVDLVSRALTERPAMVRATDRIAGPFLWTVLALAAAAVAAWSVIDPPRALWVGVAVLIVTCPCALSLAAPAALLSAAGALARRGVLVQRLDAFETLARSDVACFDKTGTLTQDRLVPADAHWPAGADAAALKSRAASLAALSRHPLSVALAAALPAAASSGSRDAWREVRELPGQGIEAIDESGRRWRLGSPGWAGVGSIASGRPTVCLAPVAAAQDEAAQGEAAQGEAAQGEAAQGEAVQGEAANGEVARFEFDEALRADAPEALAALRAQGVELRLLSGDASASARALAEKVGIAEARGDASPQDKLDALAGWQRDGRCVLMVGDGLNDAPVLARADVSFALSHGSALAQQRSDFVVLGSRLAEIPATRARAVRTMRIVRQNLLWAAMYNMLCVPLALIGWLPAWAAGAGMATSSLVVVLNALRAGR